MLHKKLHATTSSALRSVALGKSAFQLGLAPSLASFSSLPKLLKPTRSANVNVIKSHKLPRKSMWISGASALQKKFCAAGAPCALMCEMYAMSEYGYKTLRRSLAMQPSPGRPRLLKQREIAAVEALWRETKTTTYRDVNRTLELRYLSIIEQLPGIPLASVFAHMKRDSL